MAPHSSTLAWKIPWIEESGRLQSMGSLRVGHDWANFTFTFYFRALEKEMATPSSVLFWRVSGTAEPGGLLSMGSHRVRHDWSDLAAAAACSPGDSQESSPVPQFKSINSSLLGLLYGPTLTSVHDYWKNQSFDYMDLCVSKVMSLLFNMLSRFVIAFLPRSKRLLISDVT